MGKPASSHQFCTPTSPDRIHEISPAASPYGSRPCLPSPSSEFLTCFSDASADNSPEGLAVAPDFEPSLALSEHHPCLVGGINALDDASFTAKVVVHNEVNGLAPFGCVMLIDIGSHKP